MKRAADPLRSFLIRQRAAKMARMSDTVFDRATTWFQRPFLRKAGRDVDGVIATCPNAPRPIDRATQSYVKMTLPPV